MKLYIGKGFYNPKAELARKLGVLGFLESSSDEVFEAFGGIGVRTVMYGIFGRAKKIWANEGNRRIFCELRANILINSIDNVILTNQDIFRLCLKLANEGKKFKFLDVDPFGSPSKYLPYVFLLVKPGSFLYLTSTDMPTLVGNRKGDDWRIYGTYIPKIPIYPEMGLRALIYKVWNVASSLGMGIRVMFYLFERYAYRVFFQFTDSPNTDDLGFAYYCKNCGNFGVERRVKGICENCGKILTYSGNTWIGKLKDGEFLRKMFEASVEMGWEDAKRYISNLLEEPDLPFYYELSSLRVARIPRRDKIIGVLRDMGFVAGKTTFSSTGIKSNIRFKDFVTLISELG